MALIIEASEHSIKSVTVFKSSKAEVVRCFSLQLQTGQNKIKIRGLSSCIDTQSIRVSGLGDARLFDVTCTHADSNAALYLPGSAAEIKRTLLVKKAALESEKAVREQESKLLWQYAQTLNGEHVTPTQMGLFLESYVERGHKIVSAITELNEKIVAITRQIDLHDSESASKKGTALGQVDIVIVADSDTQVELKLTYIVSNVKWTPTYELHATTVNGKPSSSVSLHYRARVTQSTGEDWNNATLTLSTIASDTVVKRIPELYPVKIRPKVVLFQKGLVGFSNVQQQTSDTDFGPGKSLFGQPPQHPKFTGKFGTGRGGLFGSSTARVPSAFGSTMVGQQAAGTETLQDMTLHVDDSSSLYNEFEEVASPGAILEPTTVVSETPVAVSFCVHGESTIPSDGVEHQVSVALLSFEATISYICIPRIDPRVFLQCVVKNSSEYRLLPGPVSVIFDDSFVSKTSINDINTGDNFECTLGDDASTKVTYSRTAKTVKSDGGHFSEVTNTTTYNTKISIHNKHQFEITDLVVRDVIPTSDDKGASIVLRKPVGLADAKDGKYVDLNKDGLRVGWEPLVDGKGGEKEGKYEWRWKVAGGAKVNLETEWEIKVPGENAWVEARDRPEQQQ
ncbi:Protein F37C4.5 [Psilocybe cubensis]|uniref:Protein F37C4.5 n=1 Tax=Psilocybe cubensis TaxID=181762 RepID=A0ACB8H2J1_PSICU|nr:Protein F37C4.5 [Psilocybe cubensis]KAH9481857.1 Protein F37C4.5 [Psilocybe cubensis]